MCSAATDHRNFFRIDCPVRISQRVVGERVPRGESADSHFPDDSHFGLLRELHQFDHDSAHLLLAIGEKDRNVEAYLGHLNRKIELLARHVASLTPEVLDGDEQTVSLSEGGISYHSSRPPAPGTVLALRLTLLPSLIGITVFGTVVAAGTQGHNVSVRFENLQDADRQILARHVMQIQMSRQRGRRDHPARGQA